MTAYRYWRITSPSITPGNGWLDVPEIQLCASGTWQSDHSSIVTTVEPYGADISKISNGSAADTDVWWTEAQIDTLVITWDFGSGNEKDLDGFKFAGGSNSIYGLTGFVIHASNDGVSWPRQATISGLSYPGDYTLSSVQGFTLGYAAEPLETGSFALAGGDMNSLFSGEFSLSGGDLRGIPRRKLEPGQYAYTGGAAYLSAHPPSDLGIVLQIYGASDLGIVLANRRTVCDLGIHLGFLADADMDLPIEIGYRQVSDLIFDIGVRPWADHDFDIVPRVGVRGESDLAFGVEYLKEIETPSDLVMWLGWNQSSDLGVAVGFLGWDDSDLGIVLGKTAWADSDLGIVPAIREWADMDFGIVINMEPDATAHSDLVIQIPIYTEYGSVDVTVDYSLVRDASGRSYEVLGFELAQGEVDIHWTATVSLADPDRITDFDFEDLVTMTIGATAYKLMVSDIDHQVPERPEPDSSSADTAKLRLVSPTALLDLPVAERQDYLFDEPMLISEIAAAIAPNNTVVWDREDWPVQPYRVALSGVTPLAALAWLRDETKGVLSAGADGQTLTFRDITPDAVPDYWGSDADRIVDERNDLIETSRFGTLSRGINILDLSDVEEIEQDQVESTVDNLQAYIDIYLQPWRSPVSIRTTRGALVAIKGTVDERATIEDEDVEIKAGTGLARYPVWTLLSAEYLSDDLGSIAIASQGREIRTGTADYSLLRISYETRRLRADTEASEAGAAQFVVEEPEI